jgi:malyl-CoA/(S)-citramalyl-CoA lyase
MATTRTPRKFFEPLAIGAPKPMRERPIRLERMIHFIPGHNEKILAKAPTLSGQVDVILGRGDCGQTPSGRPSLERSAS